MGFDRKKLKQIRELILFIAAILLVLLYRETIVMGAGLLISISKPFLYGGIIAFVLNIPLCAIEGRFLKRWKTKAAARLKRPLSILASILFVVLLLSIVVATVTPQLTRTIVDLGNKLPAFAESVVDTLEKLSANYPQIQSYVAQLAETHIDWPSLFGEVVDFMRNGMSDVFLSTVSVAGNIAGGIMNMVIGFIFAIYILGQKETLSRQGKRILSAYLPPKGNAYCQKVCALLYRNFSSFISGQCLEAVILGSLFVIAMTVFRLPYAILVGVLIAFTALIPIVGAFIGCFVGAFLILVDSPVKAVIFIILFLVLQQIEGNLIYPKVVGNKVGLPAIWVLAAVSIGGSLFGIPGMLFFIPLVSTIYILLRDSVNERNARKLQQDEESGEARAESADKTPEAGNKTPESAEKIPEDADSVYGGEDANPEETMNERE